MTCDVKVAGLNDLAIELVFTCPKGDYPFLYNRATKRLSRCLCVHGSFFRGNKSELCAHARHVVQFLTSECNIKEVCP